MIRAAGLSFKLASATYVLTEIATWLSDLGASASPDEISAAFFDPGAANPTKVKVYGATEREFTLTGRWSPTVETFFNALSGAMNVAFEQSPEGTAVGKVRIYGSVNVGAWSGPIQEASGYIGFSINLSVVYRAVETIAAPPASVAVTSSSVADPSVITTTAAHGIPVGTSETVTIAGHTGSTPVINGTHLFTALTTTTGTIPVNVTVAGTGGTLQR